jgi:CBS domain containing-hemolysin-like protein
VLQEAGEAGSIAAPEQAMISGVIDLRSGPVVDVMVPWDDVVTLPADLPAREALGVMLASPFSGSRSSTSTAPSSASCTCATSSPGLDRDPLADVSELARTVPIVPPDASLDDLLRAMRAEGRHLAVVGNEYGQMLGVATLEDVLEEVVGEIEDEFDRGKRRVTRLEDGGFRVDAGMSLADFRRRTGLELDSDHANTVGGAVFDALGRGPRPGDSVAIAGWRCRSRRSTARASSACASRRSRRARPPPGPRGGAAARGPRRPTAP